MPMTHLMAEICNLAYLIMENIVEDYYGQQQSSASENRRRRKPQRPYRAPDVRKTFRGPPKSPRQPRWTVEDARRSR